MNQQNESKKQTGDTEQTTSTSREMATGQEGSKETGISRSRPSSFADLREELDRLWDTMMSASWRPIQALRQQPLPAMDVFEKDGMLHVKAELPGLTDKDVEVSVVGDTLTVTGEKRDERETKEESYYRSERSYGHFKRQLTLPARADVEHAKAQFHAGVLDIEMPLMAEEGRKKIEIHKAA